MFRKLAIAVITAVAALLETVADAITATLPPPAADSPRLRVVASGRLRLRLRIVSPPPCQSRPRREAISQARAGADEAVRRAAADAAVSAAETRIAATGRQAREAIDRHAPTPRPSSAPARPTATRNASKPPRPPASAPPASAPPAHAPRTHVQRPGGDHGIRRRVRAAARRRGPRAGRPAHRAGIPRPGARGVPQLRARAERAERDLDAARAKLASVRVRPGR